MTKKQTKDPKGENTSGGGHLGGTQFGQGSDAKTTAGTGRTPKKPK